MDKEELIFAQKYPFSKAAQKLVKEADYPLDEVPEAVVERAKLMIVSASASKPYKPEIHSSTELLKNEVLAFPISKILVSLIGRPELYVKFARMLGNSAFEYLSNEKDFALLDLASGLGVNHKPSSKPGIFAEVPMIVFLEGEFKEDFMKLANQKLSGGIVYLTKNEFTKLVSQIAYKSILNSLPLKASAMPGFLKDAAKELDAGVSEEAKKAFMPMAGSKINPDAFPPCMKLLYGKMAEGKNLNHLARFDIATFLAAIGMPKEQIISLFKNLPNFSERITKYQIERIMGKEGGKARYSAPTCAKIRSHSLCPDAEFCRNIKHPVQYYQSRVAADNAKNKGIKLQQTQRYR